MLEQLLEVKMMSNGIFITFEGGEGSGKTSALKLLLPLLNDAGYPFVLTREPGGTPIAEQIRNVILSVKNEGMDPRTEALLYCASRREHLQKKVLPHINSGVNVICDRYIDSSLAYQGYSRGLGIDNVIDINMFATEDEWPDLTIYFDISPEKGLARIAKNENREVNRLDLEVTDFHQNVYDGYHELLKRFPERIKRIDADKPLEEVVKTCYDLIVSFLSK